MIPEGERRRLDRCDRNLALREDADRVVVKAPSSERTWFWNRPRVMVEHHQVEIRSARNLLQLPEASRVRRLDDDEARNLAEVHPRNVGQVEFVSMEPELDGRSG